MKRKLYRLKNLTKAIILIDGATTLSPLGISREVFDSSILKNPRVRALLSSKTIALIPVEESKRNPEANVESTVAEQKTPSLHDEGDIIVNSKGEEVVVSPAYSPDKISPDVVTLDEIDDISPEKLREAGIEFVPEQKVGEEDFSDVPDAEEEIEKTLRGESIKKK